MNKKLVIFLMAWATLPVGAQELQVGDDTSGMRLTLDSCRAMALRNNKQLSISRVKQDVAANMRKSARTKYLPHVSALGGYEWTSKELSLLNNDQKSFLSNLGTNTTTAIGSGIGEVMGKIPQNVWQALGQIGVTPELLQQRLSERLESAGQLLNTGGQRVVDAFRTDTRNIFAGAIMVTQPVFMGGAIVAMNKMADIGEQLAANSTETKRQQTLYQIDQAYWQVVSLKHKQQLAQGYLDLVKKLDHDVQKMIEEGVATRSEGLSVSVKVNEAEMTLTQVNDGLVLSKMLLCQLCGLPMNEQILLADEDKEDLSAPVLAPKVDAAQAVDNRPEVRQLQNMVDMSRQLTRVLKAANLPQVALTGGYAISNPNVFNGFERKFAGVWNIGVLVRIPVWNWGDVAYKVRASKGATTIANLELDEAREKIELQVNQSLFHVDEANKKLEMAKASTRKADENLRTANLGFREGVISSTTVMEAQTAWLQAQSQKIDAEIDVKLSQVNLQKALGTLQ
ncbi:MAG: TolC family protein [Prevotella sp.]|nr:TolC family protein [Prevotella sp.]